MRLQNKRLLISAAGQGIGRACALACANQGADVIAVDINPETLASLAADHSSIQTHRLDVRDRAAIQQLAAAVGPLDGLFNCAGFVHHGTIMDISEDDWSLSIDLNVTSMYRMIQAFLPGMLSRAKDSGTVSILNMASMASSIKGFPLRTLYGTTKAAVIGLTKAVAADYIRDGVRCNALCPGTVDTPSLRGRIATAADPDKALTDFIARQPMGRLGTVDDISPLVLFLLSDESRFVTGQAVLVDGGATV